MPKKRVLVGVLIAAIFITAFLQMGRFDGRIEGTPSVAAMKWNPIGLPLPLFNGQSVPFQNVRPQGSWSPQSASDGSQVLQGQEDSSLVIPLVVPKATTTNGRLRFRVASLAQPAAIDLSFVVAGRGQSKEVIGELQLTEKEVIVAHESESTLIEAATFAFAKEDAGASLFRRILIDRAGDELAVFVNGEFVGRWSCHQSELIDVRIRCSVGDAQFADIDIVEIARDSETDLSSKPRAEN